MKKNKILIIWMFLAIFTGYFIDSPQGQNIIKSIILN